MPAERYYIDQSIETGRTYDLKGTEFHHLAHVMRCKKDDILEVVNGKGALAEARVQEIKKDKVLLFIEKVAHTPTPPCRLILAQALVKPNRLDFILEKGTELGVDAFWLFPGQHSSQKECFPSQIERSRALTISAMKQCGRLYLPTIEFITPIDTWQDQDYHKNKLLFFGDLDPSAPFFANAWKKFLEKEILFPAVFITGPEGGISQRENELLRQMGAIGVKLHQNILRAETASIMGISLLSHGLSVNSFKQEQSF